jgi:hypothetical protein
MGRIVSACTYLVEEGLKVETSAPEVIAGRKKILEVLLARCPGVDKLKELAREYGVEPDITSFIGYDIFFSNKSQSMEH